MYKIYNEDQERFKNKILIVVVCTGIVILQLILLIVSLCILIDKNSDWDSSVKESEAIVIDCSLSYIKTKQYFYTVTINYDIGDDTYETQFVYKSDNKIPYKADDIIKIYIDANGHFISDSNLDLVDEIFLVIIASFFTVVWSIVFIYNIIQLLVEIKERKFYYGKRN